MRMSNLSAAQAKFLKLQKRNIYFIRFARIAILLLFLLLWELSARFAWIDSFIFSSPSQIAVCFWSMVRDCSIFFHIGITLYETLFSFFLVCIFSLLIVILLWFNQTFSKILEPFLVVLNSLPKSALAPLLIVWLGATQTTIIVAGMSVAIFGSILNLYTNFSSVDPESLKLIYTLGGNKLQAMFKIVIPSCIPAIISNMKVNIGLCLVGVIIGEFLAARNGLGYLIIYSSQVFT